MKHAAQDEDSSPDERLPAPRIKAIRWPIWFIWLVPVIALAGAGYYFMDYRSQHAAEIVIRFPDASGLEAGQTAVNHLGVDIGTVSGLELTGDHSAVRVHVQLHQSALDFARQGTIFWIERASLTAGSINGLTTIVSGPYIDGIPGTGPPAKSFEGLDHKPVSQGPGIRIALHIARVGHLDRGSAVYFRGILVGTVHDVELAGDASQVDVHLFIERQYAPLVRGNSQFWIENGIDVSGSLFSGLKLNIESLRAILGGAIAFATPDDKAPQAKDGDSYLLNAESKKEWLEWNAVIPLPPADAKEQVTTRP